MRNMKRGPNKNLLKKHENNQLFRAKNFIHKNNFLDFFTTKSQSLMLEVLIYYIVLCKCGTQCTQHCFYT